MGAEEDRQLALYREFLKEEVEAGYLYRAMASRPGHPDLAKLYTSIAEAEDRHAAYWASRLRRAGVAEPRSKIGLRTRALGWVARRFGARVLIPVMARREAAERFAFDRLSGNKPRSMMAEERSHARLVNLARHGGLAGLDGAELARLDGAPRIIGGNALRAAVLGANDGLLSNTSLVMGVAGAQFASSAVLVAGLAGLLAGAFSMALGEWVSVQSSRELHQYHRRLAAAAERDDVPVPPGEADQLALLYQAEGVTADASRQMARDMLVELNVALEAGDDPALEVEDERQNPWIAAVVSFALFCLGAIVPVVP
ncbi:MAG: VIT1/CCC1 transporter family protein, partial [Acidimicrobiia bacterium]|nr:VIT1/CCC1 transporter family protein [Acidimicrobiia bacterium]